jgi:polysaccharide chain length determinant protein (PEP-CTERM system associated)
MPEEIEEQSTEIPDLQEILGIVRRRRWLFLVPFFMGWLLVWTSSWFLPTVYRSGTLILVEQPAVPEHYVVSNVGDDLQSSLNSITQQILSRTRLLQIIDQYHLYGKQGGRQLTPDEKVELMRKDTEIELVRSDDRKLSAFNIYYSARDPQVAQKATNELAQLFIRESLEAQQGKSENTTKFLEDQLEDARKSLAEQEARVREFKDKHLGELPSQLQSNLQIMSGVQVQLQSEQDALGRAEQQKTYLESLLTQYKAIEKVGKTSDGTSVPAIDKQLETLRTQLADLLSRYTEKHPDVRKLREQIADLEKTRQQLLAGSTSKSSDDTTAPTSAVEVRDMTPKMELQSQLKANQIEIANRQRTIKNLQAQLATYQARLDSAPVREQEFADITRDYNQSRANYDLLLAKRDQSEMATNLVKTQQGQRFTMLDPPNVPTRPYSPNRLKLAGIGLFAGLVLGGGIAGGAEFLDTRLHSERELRKLVSAEIIADVPPMMTPEEQSRQRRQDWITATVTAAVLCCMSLGFAITYLHG